MSTRRGYASSRTTPGIEGGGPLDFVLVLGGGSSAVLITLARIKDERKGMVLRLPIRTDVTVPIKEHLIVELYSK